MKAYELYGALARETEKVIVGHARPLKEIVLALLCRGHVLLEGVPGIAKTLMVKTLSRILRCDFARIQFTPDLMPADLVGTHVFDARTGEFHLKKGPIFTNFLLADEINRTPPKTQSALLEAMEENQATIEGEQVSLPDFFMVFATQNPIEYEGTYPLPEAQQDRFFVKVAMDYPSSEEEKQLLKKFHGGFDPRRIEEIEFAGVDPAGIHDGAGKEIENVTVSDDIFEYILSLAQATRKNIHIALGASPRAATHLLKAAKANAAVENRSYAIPDDVKAVSFPVLRHRLILRPEAEIEGRTPDNVIDGILNSIKVPRA